LFKQSETMEISRDGTPGASDSSTNTGATTVEQDDGESPEEMIERLHKNIATLSSRCARLEAQNILDSGTTA
jgi:hypothetical protein